MDEYAYASYKIEAELNNPGIEYLFAIKKDVYMGYMKLVLNATLSGYESMDALEVERIYLYKKFTGKGLGKGFMQLAMAKAKELNRDIIFLKAMDSSLEAIEFYKGLGYEICGNMQLPMPVFSLMKEKYRGMVILKKVVE
jgi:GNAT superfamily N-acetyltransferase